MDSEIEAKWLNIHVASFRKTLKEAGATLVQPERRMQRRVFDYPDGRLDAKHGWIRVRDEGDKVTLCYKQLQERSLHGMKEVTVTVDNFDNACRFLESIGLQCFTVQETKRESWLLDGAQIEIDTWPWIPSFVEIEAHDESTLRAAAKKLGLDYAAALHGSVEIAYQAMYDVTETEVNSWEEIRFTPVPDWLLAKKRSK
jgi:adenylate cyclase class 2